MAQEKGARLGNHVIRHHGCLVYVSENDRDDDFESDNVLHGQGLPALGYTVNHSIEVITSDGDTIVYEVVGQEAYRCGETLTELMTVLVRNKDVVKCILPGPDPYDLAPLSVSMRQLLNACNNPANSNFTVGFHKALITNEQLKLLRSTSAAIEFDQCVFALNGEAFRSPQHPDLSLTFRQKFPDLGYILRSFTNGKHPLKSLHLDGGPTNTVLTDRKQLDQLQELYQLSVKPGSTFSFGFNGLRFFDATQEDPKMKNMGTKDVRLYVCRDFRETAEEVLPDTSSVDARDAKADKVNKAPLRDVQNKTIVDKNDLSKPVVSTFGAAPSSAEAGSTFGVQHDRKPPAEPSNVSFGVQDDSKPPTESGTNSFGVQNGSKAPAEPATNSFGVPSNIKSQAVVEPVKMSSGVQNEDKPPAAAEPPKISFGVPSKTATPAGEPSIISSGATSENKSPAAVEPTKISFGVSSKSEPSKISFGDVAVDVFFDARQSPEKEGMPGSIDAVLLDTKPSTEEDHLPDDVK